MLACRAVLLRHSAAGAWGGSEGDDERDDEAVSGLRPGPGPVGSSLVIEPVLVVNVGRV
jgi:hypothetical protein